MDFQHMLMATFILMAPPMFAQVSVPSLKTGYAPIRELKMCYEIHTAPAHGDGMPLIVLDGGVLSTDSFSACRPENNLTEVVDIALRRSMH